MWETKVIFNGSDGNSTTTIDTSTDVVWARSKYTRELDKWVAILTPFTPNECYNLEIRQGSNTFEQHIDNQNQFKLNLIDMCLSIKNKNNNTNCSFSIEMCEINHHPEHSL